MIQTQQHSTKPGSTRDVAHRLFDRIWRENAGEWYAKQFTGTPDQRKRAEAEVRTIRSRVYAWLAKELGIPVETCHFTLFDGDLCHRALHACEKYWKTKAMSPKEP